MRSERYHLKLAHKRREKGEKETGQPNSNKLDPHRRNRSACATQWRAPPMLRHQRTQTLRGPTLGHGRSSQQASSAKQVFGTVCVHSLKAQNLLSPGPNSSWIAVPVFVDCFLAKHPDRCTKSTYDNGKKGVSSVGGVCWAC
eukprot:3732640-Rhodomonas_salina.1